MAIDSKNVVRVEREFNAPVSRVFQAIAEGVLFQTCGARNIQIDFRVGGKYHLDFSEAAGSEGHIVDGEFREIMLNKKIVFTWDSDSWVTIELADQGKTTRLKITHEGLNADHAKDVDWGWRDGLNDFTPKMGKVIRISREFSAPVERVYAAFADPAFFDHIGADLKSGSIDFRVGGKYSYAVECGGVKGRVEGEFTDIRPGEMIAYTWYSTGSTPTGPTLVSIRFETVESRTKVTLTHSGFGDDAAANNHEEGWNAILEELRFG